jgi:hypothetical protein
MALLDIVTIPSPSCEKSSKSYRLWSCLQDLITDMVETMREALASVWPHRRWEYLNG